MKKNTPGSDDSDDNVLSPLTSNYIFDLLKKKQVEKELMKKLVNVRQEIEEQQRQPQPQPSLESTATFTTTITPAEAAVHMDHGTLLLNEKQEDEEEAVSARTVLFVIIVSSYLFFSYSWSLFLPVINNNYNKISSSKTIVQKIS